ATAANGCHRQVAVTTPRYEHALRVQRSPHATWRAPPSRQRNWPCSFGRAGEIQPDGLRHSEYDYATPGGACRSARRRRSSSLRARAHERRYLSARRSARRDSRVVRERSASTGVRVGCPRSAFLLVRFGLIRFFNGVSASSSSTSSSSTA